MDVEMERNSLPTAFATSQESETATHEASNMIATASNAETASAAPFKPVMQEEASEPVTTLVSNESIQPKPLMNDISFLSNGGHAAAIESSTEPHAEHITSTKSLQAPEPSVPVSVNAESMTIVSDSAPQEFSTPVGEALEIATEVNVISQAPAAEFHTEPTPLPEQPISDLRFMSQTDMNDDPQPTILTTMTETLVDHLDPKSSTPPQGTAHIFETTSETIAAIPEESAPAAVEIAPATEVEFTSQPAQSLPPPPQPAPATLFEDQLMEDAPVSTAQDTALLPETASILRVEQPRDPAQTPLVPLLSQATQDQAMTDAPEPPQVKVARVREEDNDETEPAAKRTKTEIEEQHSTFKIPDVPASTQTPPATNGASTSGEDDTVTPARLAHMKKIISNLKKSNTSTAFRTPVDVIALNIPNYQELIKEPMDLGTIDLKLKAKEYTKVQAFVRDFNLVVNNSYTFNGREHVVSQQAFKMETSFSSQMKNMPPTNMVEPSKEEKKQQKVKAEPIRQAPPRRQSVNAGGGNARSPSTTSNAQTFALGPEGVPLIRRDSNVVDGRAKRAVVPPKRHSDFAGRPKKKKYELELKFCWEVLKKLQAGKHWQFAQYFYTPVDPVALNIPTYFQVIKKPMDLGTIQSKLENNAYEKASEFKDDVKLICNNCYKFNPAGEFINDCGHKLEDLFDKEWEAKDDWIASRQPDSEPHSAAEEDDEDEDEESEAEDDSEDDRNNKILQLQKQIEMMSKQMGELTQPKKKKKSTPPMPAKKSKTKADKKDKSAAPKARKEELQPKKKSKKPKEEKERFVTYNEKQYISNGISQLPDRQMGEALKLIQQNVPHLKGVEETEIELDIDELPNKVLLKLLHFVEKSGGGPLPAAPASEATYAAPAATGGKPKKNKPMGKSEQEAQIAELQNKLGSYPGNSGLSPGAIQSIEDGMDTSGDEGSDSEESEEE